MNYINRKGKLALQISAFSNIDCLLEYGKQNIIDILLMSEDAILELDHLKDKVKYILVLTERQNTKDNYGYPSIYKFQSADQIVLEVLEHYEKNIGEKRFISTNCNSKKIICVYSPKGGSKKTSCSLALSQYYGLSYSTLYINLELFSGLTFLTSNEKSGFSELLYYIKQKNTNFIMKLNSIVCNYNSFKFVPPANHYFDLLEMNEEDINFFIQCIRDYSEYEIIIFDIGFFGKSIIELLNCCDKIYIPVDNDFMSIDKKDIFYKQLGEAGEDEILNKVQEITLPQFDFIDREGSLPTNHSFEGTFYDYVTNLLKMEI